MASCKDIPNGFYEILSEHSVLRAAECSEGRVVFTLTLTKTLTDMDLVNQLKEFLENEAWSCSMDFRCVTPQYVFRICGEQVGVKDVSLAMDCMKKKGV